GSFAQLLVTITLGTIGLVVLKKPLLEHFSGIRIWYQFIVYGLAALTLFMGLIYFNVAGTVNLFRRWIKSERYVYLVEALQVFHFSLLIELLFFSLLRYLVFTT